MGGIKKQVVVSAPIRVYVAGPIGEGVKLHNIRRAIEVASSLRNLGFAPFVPHVYALWDLVAPREYEDWIALDDIWMKQCDVVLRIDGVSPGADREVAEAKRIGTPVMYTIGELLDWRASVQQ